MVFMAGVEEGIFPSQMAMDEGDRLDEERRLCYVGMTRAMKQLYITYAESRRIYGRENYARPSRFIKEIPGDYVQEIRMKTSVSAPASSNRFSQAQASFNDSGFNLGQRVNHPKFGEGTVTNFEGSGAQARVQVDFLDVGSKWLVVAYARLETL